MMLEVRDLHAYYGKSHILQGVDLHVDAGEIVSLLGRNGVGRSTTRQGHHGRGAAAAARSCFKGSDIAGLPSYTRSRISGSATCRRTATSFPALTVRQNLMLGIKDPAQAGTLAAGRHAARCSPISTRAPIRAAGVLSGGEQQMLTICRTLMGDPDLIMIDEPTEGLAPLIVRAGRRSARRDRPARRRRSCWSSRSCRSRCGSRTAST